MESSPLGNGSVRDGTRRSGEYARTEKPAEPILMAAGFPPRHYQAAAATSGASRLPATSDDCLRRAQPT